MSGGCDVLFYALGGGRGHVTRALAVATRLWRRGFRCRILSSNPHFQPPCPDGVHIEATPEEARRSPALLGAWISDTIRRNGPRLMIVDTFPRGIRDEFRSVPELEDVPRLCLLRHVRPDVTARRNYAAVLSRDYHGVVLCEDSPSLSAVAQQMSGADIVTVPPILIRSADEVPAPERAHELLGCGSPDRVALFVVTGARRDVSWLRQALTPFAASMARQSGWRAVVAGLPPSPGLQACTYWPLMDVLPAVSVLVGPAGYNLFHEARSLRVPAIWLPRPKQLDDQFWRARMAPTASGPAELATLLRRVCTAAPGRPAQPARFHNGAEALAERLSRGCLR